MSDERRATLAVAAMGGDKPDKRISINLTTVEMYRFFMTVIAVTLTVFGIVMGFSWKIMTYTADIRFKDRVEDSVKEDGLIGMAIDRAVDKRYNSLENRLIRIETIVLEIRDDR